MPVEVIEPRKSSDFLCIGEQVEVMWFHMTDLIMMEMCRLIWFKLERWTLCGREAAFRDTTPGSSLVTLARATRPWWPHKPRRNGPLLPEGLTCLSQASTSGELLFGPYGRITDLMVAKLCSLHCLFCEIFFSLPKEHYRNLYLMYAIFFL